MTRAILMKKKLSGAFRAAVVAAAAVFTALPAAAGDAASAEPRTRYSQQLSKIEAEGNAAGGRKIIVVDMDEALLSRLSGKATAPAAQLAQKGAPADRATESGIEQAMPYSGYFNPLSQDPQVFAYTPRQSDGSSNAGEACAIVPDTLDLSGYTRARRFWGSAIKSDVKADFAPEAFFRHVSYHELWHCLDTTFRPAADAAYAQREKDTAAYAVLLHKQEMFAEVAATLTLAAKGETLISRQRADLRAWNSYKGGFVFIRGFEDENGYSKRYDPEYYGGAFYYLTPGTDAALEHVRQAGAETVARYNAADISRIAAEITEKSALDSAQIVTMAGYFASGDAQLKKLQASAAPKDRQAAAFLQEFIARAELAGSRMATPAADGFRAPAFHAALPPEQEASAYPSAAKAAVEEDLRAIFARAAKPAPRAAAVELLDGYREKLHNAGDAKTREDYESRLTALRLMLGRGAFGPPAS